MATNVKIEKELSQGVAFGSTQGDSSFTLSTNVSVKSSVFCNFVRIIMLVEIWYNIIIREVNLFGGAQCTSRLLPGGRRKIFRRMQI